VSDNCPALRGRSHEAGLSRAYVNPSLLLSWTGAGALSGTTVLVVSSEHLDFLARGLPAGLLLDRGRKHPAKPLAPYFGRRRGWVCIRADYEVPGRLENAVRSLLADAGEHSDPALFFVGVPPTVFDDLWSRAPEAVDGGPGQPDTGQDGSEPLPEIAEWLPAYPDEETRQTLRNAYCGDSAEAEKIRRLIVLASRVDQPVLIQGESGTGKEIVARQIHRLSSRGGAKFVPVNCGAIPTELLESELFGHEKGAFTHALNKKQGLWADAREGILFLDEIGDLLPGHQVKILRALEDGRYRPVGAIDEQHSDARVIAATNRDLRSMVAAGEFREDLFFRLFTLRIRTPAVREHPEDIPELAQHLWQRVSGVEAPALSDGVLNCLRDYPWPGNVRELRAFLINLAIVAGRRLPDATLTRVVLRERSGRGGSRAGRGDG